MTYDYSALLGGSDETAVSGGNLELAPEAFRLQKVTSVDTAGREVRMPTVRASGVILVPIGQRWLIHNADSTESIEVTDRDGDALPSGADASLVLPPGQVAEVWCTDNSDQDGAWEWIKMSTDAGLGIQPPVGILLAVEATEVGDADDATWQFNPLLNEPWVLEGDFPVAIEATQNGGVMTRGGDFSFLYVFNTGLPSGSPRMYSYDVGTSWTTEDELLARDGSPFAAAGSADGDPNTVLCAGAQGPGAADADEFYEWNTTTGWGSSQALTGGVTILGDHHIYGVDSNDLLFIFESDTGGGQNEGFSIALTGVNTTVQRSDRQNSSRDSIGGCYLPGNDTFVDMMGRISFSIDENSREVWEYDVLQEPDPWTQQPDIPGDMTARRHFRSWATDDTIYVFGGNQWDGANEVGNADVWAVNNFAWTNLEFDHPTVSSSVGHSSFGAAVNA